jgi:hypothetical protein
MSLDVYQLRPLIALVSPENSQKNAPPRPWFLA